MKTNYNFSYENSKNPSTPEHNIIQKLAGRLLYQTELIHMLFEKEVFTWDDVTNLYYKSCDHDTCDCYEDMADEIYNWIAFDDASECTIERLNKAGIPYINSDFGLWIGRGDFGSAQDLYFLPLLANALYNDNL